MSRFPTFAEEFRLIDQDAYVVGTPGFDKCDASKPTIECDIRKHNTDARRTCGPGSVAGPAPGRATPENGGTQ